jgi:ribosomal protein L12E/L44/L45/RPP1/RPP2
LARLPGIVHAAALRAVATLDGTDHLPAIAVLQDLEGLEKLLPENLRYVLEARAMLVYELHAAEALSRKDYEEVLQNFDRSRAAPRAASAVLAAFQREAAVEFVAEGHREGWKYEPFESDPDVRRRHLYEDIKNKAFVLDQSDGVRVMRRAVPQASRGYVFEYAFVPAVGKPAGVPQWVLILTDASKPVHLQLVGTPDGMAVFETFPDGKSGKEVARHAFREVGGWRKIAIVPLGKMALVYDHSRLAFKVAPPEGGGLETHLEIGLTGGALKLRSLKTPEHE